jgi:hypothetical protein
MNAKEIIEKLRLTFNELVNNAAAPSEVAPSVPEMVVPTKAKLADGTEIEITEMAVGGVVSIQGQPAPVGDLTLEDGTVLSVGDNGAIVSIVSADGSVPTMIEDMKKAMDKKMGMEEVFAAFQTSANEKFSSYEQKFSDYEARFESYETRLATATKVIDGLLNLTQTLADAPTGVPDQSIKTNNNFKQEKKTSYDILFS